MDINFHPKEQDIMSDVGFANMVYQVLNLKPGAAMWAAPVCSTWVYMCFSYIWRCGCCSWEIFFSLRKLQKIESLGSLHGWHAQVTGQHIEDSAGSDGFQCGQNGGTQPNGWPCVHLVMPSPGETNLVVHGAREGQPP